MGVEDGVGIVSHAIIIPPFAGGRKAYRRLFFCLVSSGDMGDIAARSKIVQVKAKEIFVKEKRFEKKVVMAER